MDEKRIDALERKLRKLSHELTIEKIRSEIHEAILLRTRVISTLVFDADLPLPDPERAFRDARDQVLQEIEGIAAGAEKLLLNAAYEPDLDDSEKALYADEIREMIDHMKSYVSLSN